MGLPPVAEDVRMSYDVPPWAGYRRAGEVEASVELLQLEPLVRIEVIHILDKATFLITIVYHIFFPFSHVPGVILVVII